MGDRFPDANTYATCVPAGALKMPGKREVWGWKTARENGLAVVLGKKAFFAAKLCKVLFVGGRRQLART
jgi:hypothetical protein